jgi:uncharacterized repeat protein (TIGR01451 family)
MTIFLAGGITRFARVMGIVLALVALATSASYAAPTAGGTVIANTATATYSDARTGTAYGTESNTVNVTVSQVAAMTVTPKEAAVDPATEGFPQNSAITRTFTITNTGNAPDAYTVQSVTSGAGTITSIAFNETSGAVPVTLGSTTSPTLQPGQSITVTVTITTQGVAVGTSFPIALTARSTSTASANGLQSDSGKEWAIAQAVASLGGPTGANTAITKLVDQVVFHSATPGETVTYSISVKNYGGSPANNAVLTDNVPVGLTALPATTQFNGTAIPNAASLNGQVLTVHLGNLAPGAMGTVTFNANVIAAETAGSEFVNVASISADGVAPVGTTPASVLIGVANIVYDGYDGQSHPIGGAVLSIKDPTTLQLIPLVANPGGTGSNGSSIARSPLETIIGVPPGGLPPNNANTNPFVTGADGSYSFVFTQAQLGTVLVPAQYELDITATNYRSRRILLTVSPDVTGTLYNVTLKEIDNQMLAVPGGFALVANSVSLDNIFGLLGNLPMFTTHPLTVSKTVDRDTASGGDRLLYTLTVGSTGAQFGTTRIVDTLPAGVVYAPGTARVDGVPFEPTRVGRVLTWVLPTTTTVHTITYAVVVMPDVTDGTTLINLVDADAVSANGQHVTGSATADTRVTGGVLSARIIITGRVFADVRGTGHFRPGDKGLGAVRIYLENGESVTTDPTGRFTFPSVRPGQHVLRVDATTLPKTVQPYDDHRIDSTRSLQQLVHGLFDSELMQDVQFAVEPKS